MTDLILFRRNRRWNSLREGFPAPTLTFYSYQNRVSPRSALSDIYNSRDPRCKSPYGAVAAGTKVTFTIRPPRCEGFSRGLLVARLEARGDQELTVPMPWVSRCE